MKTAGAVYQVGDELQCKSDPLLLDVQSQLILRSTGIIHDSKHQCTAGRDRGRNGIHEPRFHRVHVSGKDAGIQARLNKTSFLK